MRINKAFWINAFILLISVPIVFAQPAIFQSPFFIFAINIIVVWSVLFMLQTVLMPDRLAKQKAIAWFVTLILAVIIVWVSTRGAGFIWSVGPFASLFSFKVVANTIILSGAAYFALVGLLGIKLESKQAQIGAVLFIIFLAAILAARMPNYIWETETWQSFYNFILGEEGILTTNENRVYVFIASAVIFSWFFIGFLKLGEGNNRLSYALAIIIAADLARRGLSTDTIIKVGEVFTILIIGKQLQSEFRGFGWIVAAAIVFWISYFLFGDRGIAGIIWRDVPPAIGALPLWQKLILAGVFIFVLVIVFRLGRRVTATAARGGP